MKGWRVFNLRKKPSDDLLVLLIRRGVHLLVAAESHWLLAFCSLNVYVFLTINNFPLARL
jgi:hypothetical protein